VCSSDLEGAEGAEGAEGREKKRCGWARKGKEEIYHDREWGRPVYADLLLFEMLLLEGFQGSFNDLFLPSSLQLFFLSLCSKLG